MTKPAPERFLAIGNALVDILAPVEDGFLNLHGLEPGSMHLLSVPESQHLLSSRSWNPNPPST